MNKPRIGYYFGMRIHSINLNLHTWLEGEEFCYPSGNMARRARAFNTDTGKLQIVKCGLPDTYFSIPATKGYLTVSDGGILIYHPSPKHPN